MPATRIVLPARARKGEVVEIKTIITHPMETGYRRDHVGLAIARDIITRFTCTYAGEEVFRMDLFTGVAANPFVGRFYPNFHQAEAGLLPFGRGPALVAAKRLVEWLLAVPSHLAEILCRRAYRAYLAHRTATWRSPEQVRLQPDCLKLHTHSHRQSVLDRFDHAVRLAIDGAAHVATGA